MDGIGLLHVCRKSKLSRLRYYPSNCRGLIYSSVALEHRTPGFAEHDSPLRARPAEAPKPYLAQPSATIHIDGRPSRLQRLQAHVRDILSSGYQQAESASLANITATGCATTNCLSVAAETTDARRRPAVPTRLGQAFTRPLPHVAEPFECGEPQSDWPVPLQAAGLEDSASGVAARHPGRESELPIQTALS